MIKYKKGCLKFDPLIKTKRYTVRKGNDYSHEYRKNTNIIITFDIETTSFWSDEKGNIYRDIPLYNDEFYLDKESYSLCYIWQASIEDTVYYDRNLETFKDFLLELSRKTSNLPLVIWVHNLSFEYQFLLNILTPSTVFAREKRKPVKVTYKEFPQITFRCSYMLSNLNLASWGKELGLPKLVGDLDYSIIRTPYTPLTDTELGYCERDCLVVYKGIKKELETYGTLDNIPMTSTGKVRKEVKKLLTNQKGYMKYITKMLPQSYEELKILERVFQGGYTHANYINANKVHKAYCNDFASSYPFVMCSEMFPIERFRLYAKDKQDIYLDTNRYCYLLNITLTNVRAKSSNHYISKAKCEYIKDNDLIITDIDNGRVISTGELNIWITEQDLITIKNNYEFSQLNYNIVYKARKSYLPKPFIEYILELYCNKTTLKNVVGYEDLYMKSKQFINSMFGMTVTKMLQDDVLVEDGEWNIKLKTPNDITEYLQRLQKQPKRNHFLSFAWGVWVTAYARRNLWECMEYVGDDVIYCDTDSIKYKGERRDFSWYNEKAIKKLEKMCKHYNIDIEKTRPKDPKGEVHQLGLFDEEEPCVEFKTLGAKRYCVRHKEDSNLEITVAGVSKTAWEQLDNDIENFEDGFVFERGQKGMRKMTATYKDGDIKPITMKDGYRLHHKYGIVLRNVSYTMGLDLTYLCLILSKIKEGGRF